MSRTGADKLEMYRGHFDELKARFKKLDGALDVYFRICPSDISMFLYLKNAELREKFENMEVDQRVDTGSKRKRRPEFGEGTTDIKDTPFSVLGEEEDEK